MTSDWINPARRDGQTPAARGHANDTAVSGSVRIVLLLTVVIATFNRCALLLRALHALERQQSPGPFEVVVVVDGSTDDSAQSVRAASWLMPVRVVEQMRGGSGRARNAGAAAARGDILLFLDDDMEPQPGFLHAMRSAVAGGVDVAVATLHVDPLTPVNVLTREFDSWRLQTPKRAAPAPLRFDEVLFSATGIRTAWFKRVGGFDEAFTAGGAYGNEDIELGYRLALAGARVEACTDAVAYTKVVLDPEQMLLRTRGIGRNDVRLVTKHPQLTDAIFGDKLRRSRIHRAVSRTVLRHRTLRPTFRALRGGVIWLLRHGFETRLPYRIWFGVLSLEYWSAVAEARGAHK